MTALACAGMLIGCGGDDDEAPSDSGGGGGAAAVSEVAMLDDLKFDPSAVTAAQGADITVKNTGSLQHDLKLRQDGDEIGGTEVLAGGKSATLNVSFEPGTYEMYCSIPGHEQGGMKGTFTVA